MLVINTTFHLVHFRLLAVKILTSDLQKRRRIAAWNDNQSICIADKNVTGHYDLPSADNRNIDFSRTFSVRSKWRCGFCKDRQFTCTDIFEITNCTIDYKSAQLTHFRIGQHHTAN